MRHRALITFSLLTWCLPAFARSSDGSGFVVFLGIGGLVGVYWLFTTMVDFAERAHAGRLKTQSSWWEINGRSVKAVGELLREHWLIGSIIVIFGLVAAVARAWPTLAAAIK